MKWQSYFHIDRTNRELCKWTGRYMVLIILRDSRAIKVYKTAMTDTHGTAILAHLRAERWGPG